MKPDFQHQKWLEKPENLTSCCRDYEKTFASVWRSTVWSVWKRIGVNGLYSDQCAAVRIEGELTDWFSIQKRVTHGCPVLYVSFSFYLEVMRMSAHELVRITVNISGRQLSNFCFTNDIVLIATSAKALWRPLDEVPVDAISTEFQLKISMKRQQLWWIQKKRSHKVLLVVDPYLNKSTSINTWHRL